MPSLKDLSCSVELSDDQKPLPEFGTVYGDAIVETFIPIPKKQQTFTIHLSSKNFIAPGIAMFVFIDGVYQCNRNRQNLKLRQPPDRRSLVDFRVRQKEERQKDGSMVAREWTFENLGHVLADGAPLPNTIESIGCIEVFVLRCAGPRNAKTPANMNLDGATDGSDHHFDRESRSRATAWDDRGPLISASSNGHGPPPPIPFYRSPYAETVHTHQGTATQHQRGSSYGREPSPFTAKKAYSRFSEPVSPDTRPRRDIPAPGFQYGSGPLPPHTRSSTHRELLDEDIPSGSLGGAPTVDPALLEKIVIDAVKRGVEQSRRTNTPVGDRADEHDVENSSQVPGAWPRSPEDRQPRRSALSAHYDRDSTWERHSSDRKQRPTSSKAGTRVAWDEEIGWENRSRADGWDSPDNICPDSWNTEEKWSKKPQQDWEEVGRRSRSRGRTARIPSPRRASHASHRTSTRRRSSHGRSRPMSRAQSSHWRDDTRSSSEDNNGWTYINAATNSTTSDSTLNPSQSRSQTQPRKSKSTRRLQRESIINTPQRHPESAYYSHPPSVLVTNAPTFPSTPPPHHHRTVPSRRESIHTQPTAPTAAPPPTWGCASETTRKGNIAAAYIPPAPFTAIGEVLAESWKSSGSSSWGGERETARGIKKKQASWDREAEAKSAWGGVGKGGGSWDVESGVGWGGGGGGGDRWEGDGWASVSIIDYNNKHDDEKHKDAEKWKREVVVPTTTTVRRRRRGRGKSNEPANTPTKRGHHNTQKTNLNTTPPTTRPTTTQTITNYEANTRKPPSNANAPGPTKIPPSPYRRNTLLAVDTHLLESTAPPNVTPTPNVTAPPTPTPARVSNYGHLTNQPLYVDGLGEAYAVFRFRCCREDVERRGWLCEEGEGEKEEKEEGDDKGKERGKWVEEWVELYS